MTCLAACSRQPGQPATVGPCMLARRKAGLGRRARSQGRRRWGAGRDNGPWRNSLPLHQATDPHFSLVTIPAIMGILRRHPALTARTTCGTHNFFQRRYGSMQSTWPASCSEAVFRWKAKKFCDGILLIWSTKWSLFSKLFAKMGCKSRDESNDAN